MRTNFYEREDEQEGVPCPLPGRTPCPVSPQPPCPAPRPEPPPPCPMGQNTHRWIVILRNLLPFFLAGLVACIFASVIQSEWNRRVFRLLHSEIDMLSMSVDRKMTAMENSTKQIVILLSALEGSFNPSCSEGNTDDLIKKYLELYDADKTGMTDYALESLGGCILSTRGTKSYKEGLGKMTVFGVPVMSYASDPRTVIQASVLPGECWAFQGSRGNVVIRLVAPIIVSNVSIEHIPLALSPTGDITSAPKNFNFYGLESVDSHPFLFGAFIYDIKKTPLQTFRVQKESRRPYDIVEVEVVSNHGKEYTCLYRIRVHGRLPGHDSLR